jgi:hypothetical protein
MDKECSTLGGEEECIQGLGMKTRRKETPRKTFIGGRIILNWILGKQDGGMDWIHSAHDGER